MKKGIKSREKTNRETEGLQGVRETWRHEQQTENQVLKLRGNKWHRNKFLSVVKTRLLK